MYSRLSGWLDQTLAKRDEMIQDADPDTALEPICVWTNRGQVDPSCPPGFERMPAHVRDFQAGGPFAEGGGGTYWGPIIEEGVDPQGDAPTVDLGLEYSPAPSSTQIGIAAAALALLLFIPTRRR